MKGKLKLKFLEAKLFREHDIFGTKDTFITIEYNHDRFYTKECKNWGKHSMFSDEEFEMDVKGTGDNITLKIMTRILVTECYALAMTSFNISSFCVNG